MNRSVRVMMLAALGLLVSALTVQAQSRVRVTRDQTVIWRPGFVLVEAIVRRGTELDVVARLDDWYEVVLPEGNTRPRSTGLVAMSRVEALDEAGPGGSRIPRSLGGTSALARHGVRGFGQVGLGRFRSGQTFAAVFGSSAGMWVGGGVEERYGSWTFEGALDVFRRTGERAFVLNGQVFPLGLPDTVTILPISATVGYRRQVSRAWSAVAGGGLGRYFFRESSRAGDETETFTTQAASYHLRADLEWHRRGLVTTAAEVQYTWVPGALSSGLAKRFDERDLGGFQIRFKILVGR